MHIHYTLCHAYIICTYGQYKPILWGHLEELYKKNTKSAGEAMGFQMVSKLKFEHVYLSPFSKMRVDLAAHV